MGSLHRFSRTFSALFHWLDSMNTPNLRHILLRMGQNGGRISEPDCLDSASWPVSESAAVRKLYELPPQVITS